MSKYNDFINLVRNIYKTEDFIPLHAPIFKGNEKQYLIDCIDTTFVSSVGQYVDKFERLCAQYTGAQYAIATMNGTAALHTALVLSDVNSSCEVITQPLTFIATTNAISYTGASPIFVDVDRMTMGMCPKSLLQFLDTYSEIKDGKCYNKQTGKTIKACVPMHTFGFPCKIDEIKEICHRFHITLIEDAAESLGSTYNGKHTGTFGTFGVLSFNGNKTITCGGGGIILTDDEKLAHKAKHITTTAKVPHKWEYDHDVIGYNYRLTNLSAALGCAQMEELDNILNSKRIIASQYEEFFKNHKASFVRHQDNTTVNYWLNTLIMDSLSERDLFLEETNKAGIMTRPIWKLMSELEMFTDAHCENLANAQWLSERVVNIPSSAL